MNILENQPEDGSSWIWSIRIVVYRIMIRVWRVRKGCKRLRDRRGGRNHSIWRSCGSHGIWKGRRGYRGWRDGRSCGGWRCSWALATKCENKGREKENDGDKQQKAADAPKKYRKEPEGIKRANNGILRILRMVVYWHDVALMHKAARKVWRKLDFLAWLCPEAHDRVAGRVWASIARRHNSSVRLDGIVYRISRNSVEQVSDPYKRQTDKEKNYSDHAEDNCNWSLQRNSPFTLRALDCSSSLRTCQVGFLSHMTRFFPEDPITISEGISTPAPSILVESGELF